MSEKDKATALVVKARFYRLAALIFAVMGLFVFAIMYFQVSNGNFLAALRDPFFVVVVIFPFLPAVILSWMAARAEKKLGNLLESRRK